MPQTVNRLYHSGTARRQVVITSFGVISSLGNTPESILDNMIHDRVFFQRPDFDPTVAASPVKGFDLKSYTGRYKDARYLNRGASFAAASALIAVRNSGLPLQTMDSAGLFTGVGPNMDISGEFKHVHDGMIENDDLPALFLLRHLPNTAASAISRLCGVHGENITMGSACSASLMAIGEAYRKIKDGYLDVALAGGGDSRITHGGILAYKKARALWQGDEDPGETYAPFDMTRKGFITGEGGAFFVLESLDHAVTRGARIYACISGYGSTLDGLHMTAPDTEGIQAGKALEKALQEAELDVSEVDMISSHGTGTVLNDMTEAAMIARVFRYHRPAIIALKSYIGHTASACGAVELALSLICIEKKLCPGIRNLKTPLDPDLNFMRRTTQMEPENLVIENFGFGGQNSVLVIRPWNP